MKMSNRTSLQDARLHTEGHHPSDMIITDSAEVAEYQLEVIRNRVILGSAFSVLQKLPPECADLVFIDPPYYLQLPPKVLHRWKVKTAVNGVDDEWDRFASFQEYDEFITRLLTEVRRVMKPSATVWVIGTYHNIFRVGKIMQDIGYWILNDVVWVKTNPMPNWLGVRFTNATEHLIWAVKDRRAKGYTFHREYARQFGIGRVGANVWLLPLCSGKERLKDGDGSKLHSTQKPVELLRRVILTATSEGDVVLDPVAGTGTTGYVAKMLGRDYIMVEVNPRYVEGIVNRFAQTAPATASSSPKA